MCLYYVLTGVMYCELFRIWFEWMDFVNPSLYFGDWYCKINNFTNGVVRDYSNWLIACLTLERLIMVAAPFFAKDFCTVKRAKVVTLGLFFTLCVPHSHNIIYSTAQKKTSWVCWEDPTSQTAKVVGAVVEITVGYIVVVVVFILNIALTLLLVRCKLCTKRTGKSHHSHNRTQKEKQCSKKQERTQRRLTRTLIIVATVFLVCETPRIITAFICRFMQRTPTKRIILNLSYLLSGINHASNFWIYIFSSPRFRHIFMRELKLAEKKEALVKYRQRRKKKRLEQINDRESLIESSTGGGRDGKFVRNIETGCLKIEFKTVLLDDDHIQLSGVKVKQDGRINNSSLKSKYQILEEVLNIKKQTCLNNNSLTVITEGEKEIAS